MHASTPTDRRRSSRTRTAPDRLELSSDSYKTNRPLRRIARGARLVAVESAYFANDFAAVTVPTEAPRTMRTSRR